MAVMDSLCKLFDGMLGRLSEPRDQVNYQDYVCSPMIQVVRLQEAALRKSGSSSSGRGSKRKKNEKFSEEKFSEEILTGIEDQILEKEARQLNLTVVGGAIGILVGFWYPFDRRDPIPKSVVLKVKPQSGEPEMYKHCGRIQSRNVPGVLFWAIWTTFRETITFSVIYRWDCGQPHLVHDTNLGFEYHVQIYERNNEQGELAETVCLGNWPYAYTDLDDAYFVGARRAVDCIGIPFRCHQDPIESYFDEPVTCLGNVCISNPGTFVLRFNNTIIQARSNIEVSVRNSLPDVSCNRRRSVSEGGLSRERLQAIDED